MPKITLNNAKVVFSQIQSDFITKDGKNIGRSLKVLADDELMAQLVDHPEVANLMGQGFTELPLTDRKDKDKVPTGEKLLRLNFKKFQKSGKMPLIVNKAKEATLDEPVFGQRINVSLLLIPYEAFGKVGISLRVLAVQLLDKPESTTSPLEDFEVLEGSELEI